MQPFVLPSIVRLCFCVLGRILGLFKYFMSKFNHFGQKAFILLLHVERFVVSSILRPLSRTALEGCRRLELGLLCMRGCAGGCLCSRPSRFLLDAHRGLGQACPDHRTQLVRRVYGMPLLC